MLASGVATIFAFETISGADRCRRSILREFPVRVRKADRSAFF
jgi:hypothetical protein